MDSAGCCGGLFGKECLTLFQIPNGVVCFCCGGPPACFGLLVLVVPPTGLLLWSCRSAAIQLHAVGAPELSAVPESLSAVTWQGGVVLCMLLHSERLRVQGWVDTQQRAPRLRYVGARPWVGVDICTGCLFMGGFNTYWHARVERWPMLKMSAECCCCSFSLQTC